MNLLRKKGVSHKDIRKEEKKKNVKEIEKVERSSAGLGKFSLKDQSALEQKKLRKNNLAP